jgi:hypothetical protein
MIIGEGVLAASSESPDGLHCSLPTLLCDGKEQPAYVTPVGMGDDPRILGKQFSIYYTVSSSIGWLGNTLNRHHWGVPVTREPPHTVGRRSGRWP